MNLNTFGGVMGFAVDYEGQAADWCVSAAAKAADARLKAWLTQVAEARAKRKKLMERVRRENVTEMILEPIVGLTSEPFEPGGAPPGTDAELRQSALKREELAEQFYLAASAKVSIPEVARIFRRIAREIAECRQAL